MKKLFVCLVAAVSMAAAAETHRVTLFQESTVNGSTLKPGDYKLTVDSNKVTLVKGKDKAEADVTVQPGGTKFSSTSVRYSNGDGKYRIKEIRLGGTTTTLVFNN